MHATSPFWILIFANLQIEFFLVELGWDGQTTSQRRAQQEK